MTTKPWIKTPLIFVIAMWAVYLIDLVIPFDFNRLGIKPRDVNGLIGVLTSPFLHGGLGHLISNTIPAAVLLGLTTAFHNKRAPIIVPFIILIGGLVTWTIGGAGYHVGASGLIYGLAAFLITSGILSRRLLELFISLFVALLYGIPMIWGMLPIHYKISWEGHVSGAAAGIWIAFLVKDYVKKQGPSS